MFQFERHDLLAVGNIFSCDIYLLCKKKKRFIVYIRRHMHAFIFIALTSCVSVHLKSWLETVLVLIWKMYLNGVRVDLKGRYERQMLLQVEIWQQPSIALFSLPPRRWWFTAIQWYSTAELICQSPCEKWTNRERFQRDDDGRNSYAMCGWIRPPILKVPLLLVWRGFLPFRH